MFDFIFKGLKNGIEKIKNNPQLIYTVVVAFLITGAFVFVSERFIRIANDAEERLVNVRVGALQDAFSTFSVDNLNNSEYLNTKISQTISNNETINSFRVIIREKVFDQELNKEILKYKIIASNIKEETGEYTENVEDFFRLASLDTNSSVTTQVFSKGERFFYTTRALMSPEGEVLGVLVTSQTLSMADLAIKRNIQNSKILLFVIILLIMLLFFRHSKIVDYIQLYKKLKEVDQLKDDFVSMASHELRTPLSIIRGYADFIKDAPELSAETKENVSRIDISVKQLDGLITEILDVSRLEQGRMMFEFVEVNPKDLILEITNSFILNAKEKGLNVSFDASSVKEEQIIKIDLNKLRQVLINIIGNAVKYTKKGEVLVRQYEEKGRLYIRVSDTGVGMSAEEREKLFEKFYRIRNEDTHDIRGTGLGLWITRQIVRQMSGDIFVESIKGVGSHFIVYFPIIKK